MYQKIAANEAVKNAVQAVRDAQLTEDPSTGSNLLDVCIRYDSTWYKRGHTSQFGVGVAIELATGLVLDFSV